MAQDTIRSFTSLLEKFTKKFTNTSQGIIKKIFKVSIPFFFF